MIGITLAPSPLSVLKEAQCSSALTPLPNSTDVSTQVPHSPSPIHTTHPTPERPQLRSPPPGLPHTPMNPKQGDLNTPGPKKTRPSAHSVTPQLHTSAPCPLYSLRASTSGAMYAGVPTVDLGWLSSADCAQHA